MQAFLLSIISRLIQWLPYQICCLIAYLLGFILFSIIRIRRNIVLQQIEKCFKNQYSHREIREIARKSYYHYVLFLLEFIRLPRFTPNELKENLTMHGIENIKAAYKQKRGILIASGHIGLWELGAAALSAHGYPGKVYAQPIHNIVINQWINNIRASHYIQVISKKFAIRHIIQFIEQNGIVGLLLDQDARRHGIFVPFLGSPSSTFQGPAYISIRANCPIIPCFVIRRWDNRKFDVYIEPAIEPDLTQPESYEIERITKILNSILESYIYKYPEQYFWFHRRWKTIPDKKD